MGAKSQEEGGNHERHETHDKKKEARGHTRPGDHREVAVSIFYDLVKAQRNCGKAAEWRCFSQVAPILLDQSPGRAAIRGPGSSPCLVPERGACSRIRLGDLVTSHADLFTPGDGTLGPGGEAQIWRLFRYQVSVGPENGL